MGYVYIFYKKTLFYKKNVNIIVVIYYIFSTLEVFHIAHIADCDKQNFFVSIMKLRIIIKQRNIIYIKLQETSMECKHYKI